MDRGNVISLDLRDLRPFCSATIRASVLAYSSEAASAILWRFHDVSKGACGAWTRRGSGEASTIEVELLWEEATPDVLETHNNEKDATEYAAYAVAFAVAGAMGFKIIGRTHQGSRVDWVMVREGEPANDYYKLEVSGIARVGGEGLASRLREKVGQGRGGDWKRPGVAIVARFEDVEILSEAWQ